MSSRCLDPRVAPALLAVALLVLLAGCEREMRRYAEPARAPEHNAYDVAQGKRWFRWYNCNGCHANGGGAMGPALTDERWRYGSDFEAVLATIRDGRPNGMPAFGGRVPEPQLRQLAAYVRSMSGSLRTDVAPSRGDTMSTGEPESRREHGPFVAEPPASGASR